MLTAQIPTIDDEQGLIWYWFNWFGSTWYGHDGGDWGINTDMIFRQEDGAGVILLVNGELSFEGVSPADAEPNPRGSTFAPPPGCLA